MKKDEDIITNEKQVAILFQGDLRDWFAGMAMQSWLACGNADLDKEDITARECYLYADAMLKERDNE